MKKYKKYIYKKKLYIGRLFLKLEITRKNVSFTLRIKYYRLAL